MYTKVEMKEVNLERTFLQGLFPEDTKYEELVRVFGLPNASIKDPDIYVGWHGEIDGEIFTIYHYKTGGERDLPVDKITEWHIGGRSQRVAQKLIAYFNERKEV